MQNGISVLSSGPLWFRWQVQGAISGWNLNKTGKMSSAIGLTKIIKFMPWCNKILLLSLYYFFFISLKIQWRMCTHTFFFSPSHKELPQLADGIRADAGRPARLCAMAPSSSAAVCLSTWRTGKRTGARGTVTVSLGSAAESSLPESWHKLWPKMMALFPPPEILTHHTVSWQL